ncbi:MAG: YceI family protein [Burkholderia sp.]|jgi:polyisoprenoid-binding protein YceI|nr:YceI family protein [Burkholderia sp.]
MLTRPPLLRSVALALAFSIAVPSVAALLKTDPAKNSVSAVFKQMNVPVEGKFKKFNAQIDFDAAMPESSKASMEIDINSFDLGDAEFNSEAQKKEWFNSARFPKATFTSSAIKPGSNGKFDVTGKLTIKGRTADVNFPLIVKKEGTNQVFEGALPIKRLAFNIGEGEWKDTGTVADEIIIKFRVVAAQ